MAERSYADYCRECGDRLIHHHPYIVLPTSDTHVRAEYICPSGHVWFTSWAAPTDTEPVGRPGQQQNDQLWPESGTP